MTDYTKIQERDEKEMAEIEKKEAATKRTIKLIEGVLSCTTDDKEGLERAWNILGDFRHCLFLSNGDDMYLYDTNYFSERLNEISKKIDDLYHG